MSSIIRADRWQNSLGVAYNSVLQVVSTTKTDTFSMSSSTYADITGLSATITPYFATSKIYIVASVVASQTVGTNNGFVRFARGGSAISIADVASTRIRSTATVNAVNGNYPENISLTFLDSPATTSATTYSIQIATNGSSSIFVNRGSTDSDSSLVGRTVSSITVMEIAQ
jgi:hypothetical protein